MSKHVSVVVLSVLHGGLLHLRRWLLLEIVSVEAIVVKHIHLRREVSRRLVSISVVTTGVLLQVVAGWPIHVCVHATTSLHWGRWLTWLHLLQWTSVIALGERFVLILWSSQKHRWRLILRDVVKWLLNVSQNHFARLFEACHLYVYYFTNTLLVFFNVLDAFIIFYHSWHTKIETTKHYSLLDVLDEC